ncbi:hypothetical protein BCV69DRAFT_282664 [Microstroma glucosiphilum]|uniref:polynucleotide adenylyltransferase n=1 Tax=Pseudomicrostroma glucosiphilum TaxID=1684307 RepID=A0A316U9U0_9BASI|nr:hypothetical protein BCV69DRAFT_282664 [Pseudomicrostroma glucosiphilum]PWN21173.1 hypothetical protein BCV69DRAFT_282664 [Pseudomicrostroma glucosiphilum]
MTSSDASSGSAVREASSPKSGLPSPPSAATLATAASATSPRPLKPAARRASVDAPYHQGSRSGPTPLVLSGTPSSHSFLQAASSSSLNPPSSSSSSPTPSAGLPNLPLASSLLPWHHHQHQSKYGAPPSSSPASLASSPFEVAQQQGGALPGGSAALYPGRAASLPGSLHHHQSQSGGRHQQVPSHQHQQSLRSPHSSVYSGGGGGSSASSAAGGASLSMGAGYSPQTQQALHSPLMRANPQVRMANGANGTLPAGYYNLSGITSAHHHGQSSMSYERYTAELTNCIIAFLSPILPTEEEYRIKEATRRQLERLAAKVSPGAKLLAFGSMANGFALRNSDMDLCCLINRSGDQEVHPSASELVEMLSKVIREETDFNVLALPKARIPIIKISRGSTSELPYEISCDIGFENRLALENTRLLLSYAMVDPPRLRTLVLFLKVWTKRRKLNSPYTGTLSSYGYTLLVLFYLTHVKRPAVLPNLQRIPPTRPLAPEEVELNGHNIYFYDDMATLRKDWQSQNTENVAELLIDFFRYFAKEHPYSREVISLKTETGMFGKDAIMWNAELCIEDPFQHGYNVSRTVTKDGLYTIRGEFIRATRILQNRNQRVSAQLAELCEEREDFVARAPDTPPLRHRYQSANAPFNPHHHTYDSHSQQRRGNTVGSSGVGGSFAFEEMARGLGRQRGQMAYPTTAMLAPLSQSGGLSPLPHTSGLRVMRDASTPASRSTPRAGASVPPSTRSDDGNASGPPYEEGSRVAHASARTSPTFASAVPAGGQGNNALGEAWAFGSEIVFGSEKFRLHPHPRLASVAGGSTAAQNGSARSDTSANPQSATMTATGSSSSQPPYHVDLPATSLAAAAAATVGNRATRSFSDGQNRSQSLGRPYRAKGSTLGDIDGTLASLHLAVDEGTPMGDSGESSGRMSPTASSDAPSHLEADGGESFAPMQEYTAAWAEKQLRQQHASAGELDKQDSVSALGSLSTPVLNGESFEEPVSGQHTSAEMVIGSPLSAKGHVHGPGLGQSASPLVNGRAAAYAGGMNNAPADDAGSDLSEGVLDELSRVSEMDPRELEG